MKEIVRRLRQLEEIHVPVDRDRAIAVAILAARRQRLGPDHEGPPHFPPENYSGCPTIADRIVRCRQLLMERDRQLAASGAVPNLDSFR
jgi:hypothetical protein